MQTSLIVMKFSPSTSIPRLSVVVYVIVLPCLSFCDALAQNGVRPGTCIGFGGFDDSCPTGMYCDSKIGGTCLNCSICYPGSFLRNLIPLKCQCDSSVTGSSAICESIPASDQIGRPVESEEDVNRLIPKTVINDFKGYFDGTAVKYMPCADLTTSSSELTTYGLLTPYLSTPLVQDNSHDDSSTETGHPVFPPVDHLTEQCMDPGNPVNGHKKHVNYTEGGVIEFACNKSYSLQGKKFIYCMEHGKWSDEIPTCDKDKGMLMLLVPAIVLSCVVFMVVFVLVAMWCYRHKVRSGSISRTPSNCSDAEDPPSDERNCDDVPSEKDFMLPVCPSSISSCSEKLTELAWSAVQSSLQTLFEDEEFRRVFLNQLFIDTSISNCMLNNVCSLTGELLVKGVREQAEIFDVDLFRIMGRILTDSSLRRYYPEKGESMDKLVQLLNGAHKSCDRCNGTSQLPSDYNTAV